MSRTFRLPDLGEGIKEAEILDIAVEEGQRVEEGETILEVETDKAAVEIPSPWAGIVASVEVARGDVVPVGEVLLTFRDRDEAPPQQSTQEPNQEPKQQHPEEREGAAGNTAEGGVSPRKDRVVPASPSTRRVARELGVDLVEVPASGANGVVTTEDVRRHAGAGQKSEEAAAPAAGMSGVRHGPGDGRGGAAVSIPELPDFSRWGEIERQPFRSIRRATAKRMAASWSEIPHVNCQDVADITSLEAFRQRHKADIAAAGGRLTMTVFALKAVATALKSYPQFNASLDPERQEIIIKHYFHIGIAVDTEHGLVVPVIREVDRKSIRELSIELHEAVFRARRRGCSREEMQGGTFTITNAGAVGGGFFSAIINHPEVAILGLGQARKQPAVVTGGSGRDEIVPRLLMPVVLCFDHRVADGADAVRFQRLIIEALEDPDELLISMI